MDNFPRGLFLSQWRYCWSSRTLGRKKPRVSEHYIKNPASPHSWLPLRIPSIPLKIYLSASRRAAFADKKEQRKSTASLHWFWWNITAGVSFTSPVQDEEWDGDVPFIPQPDSSPLIIYQAGRFPEPSIECGGREGNKTRLVEVKYVPSWSHEQQHCVLYLCSALLEEYFNAGKTVQQSSLNLVLHNQREQRKGTVVLPLCSRGRQLRTTRMHWATPEQNQPCCMMGNGCLVLAHCLFWKEEQYGDHRVTNNLVLRQNSTREYVFNRREIDNEKKPLFS